MKGEPHGIGDGPVLLDSIDRVIAGWERTRPDLDVRPIGVFARLSRLHRLLGEHAQEIFSQFELNGPDFAVLATLTRLGPPHRLTQRTLMSELNLSSGTVSVRVSRLVSAGLVSRKPDPDDRRGAIVALTARGADTFDRCAPLHLANERRLLSGFSDEDQTTFANLLREMLSSFESADGDGDTRHWGMSLAPAHIALQMRQDVGLPERPGLLVRGVEPASPAADADIRKGDLLIGANGYELRSLVDLHAAAQDDGTTTLRLRLMRGTKEHRRDVGSGVDPRSTVRSAQ